MGCIKAQAVVNKEEVRTKKMAFGLNGKASYEVIH